MKLSNGQLTAVRAINELNDMDERSDAENAHSRADELLLQVLYENGYSSVAEAYNRAKERVGFWYA